MFDRVCVNFAWITRTDGTRDVAVMFSDETWAGIVHEECTANSGTATTLPFDQPFDHEWTAIGQDDRKLYNSMRGLDLVVKGNEPMVRALLRKALSALIKSLARDPSFHSRKFFRNSDEKAVVLKEKPLGRASLSPPPKTS